jgi:hypothetical protein
MTELLVLYYSSYGHVKTLAQAIAEGAQSVPGVEVTLKRVPETMPPSLTVPTNHLALTPLIGGWTFGLRNVVFNAAVVVLLAWVVMPVVTRILRPWLQPQAGSIDRNR